MSRWIGYCMTTVLLAATVSLASCGKVQTTPEKGAAGGSTDQASPRTFASPSEAGTAVFEAAKTGDQAGLLAIFCADGKEMLFSGDTVEDKNNREHFLSKYSQMNRWSVNKSGGQTLYIGADNFPFPVPLKKNDAGRWFFDTTTGKEEVLARRVGNNELVTINVLGDVAGAQDQYFKTHARQYAQKFVSDPGQQNGLYWEVAQGQSPSPLAPLADVAKALGYSDKPQVFNGYHYRMLTRQGADAKGGAGDYVVNGKMTAGFAVIAYPAVYGDSGIMTFMVGPDGVVYQKDLGDKTAETAASMTDYNPDKSWASLSAEPIQSPTGPKRGEPERSLRASVPK
jgi:hypothetical protein